ncbi:hypothetical protein [Streptomyces anulatus]|uniref:hypothetical protein n=1 Tax=Streptomyces anulatus TaxID=1892 RepID=UPI0037DDA3F0|nr:hypothetical protein OHB50_39170 [Streptomyces anulatus]
MTIDNKLLTLDLIARTEKAVQNVAHLAVDTRIAFAIDDIVDAVERGLPSVYPAPTTGAGTRRDLIADMARRILDGSIYEES